MPLLKLATFNINNIAKRLAILLERLPEPRALYQQLLAQGWMDAIKATHPDEAVYTFWDYLRQAWERNAGMRLDHILLSASLAPSLCETGVDAWVRGLPGASDHAPVWANIETNPPSSTRRTRRRSN